MCLTPEVPVFDGSRIPNGEPVRCVTCGGELLLVCTKNVKHQSLPDANQVRRGVGQPRVYQKKPCAACLRAFQPSGPRALYCDRDDCDDVAAARHTTAHPAAPTQPGRRS